MTGLRGSADRRVSYPRMAIAALLAAACGAGPAAAQAPVNISNTPNWDEATFAWSPAVPRVAFVSEVAPGEYHLCTAHVDGGGLQDISATVGGQAGLELDWSPTTGELAWIRDVGGARDIVVCSHDGSQLRILSTVAHNDVSSPVFSPDGTTVAWLEEDTGGLTILVAAAASGGGRTLLSAPGVQAGLFAWSPNGQNVAYIHGDARTDIAVVNVVTHGTVLVTHAAANESVQLPFSWSPDSQWLAYAVEPVGATPETGRELWVVRSDGSGRRRLTFNAEPDYDPRWSPSGDRIAFVNGSGTTRHVLAIRPDGTGLTNVSQLGGQNSMPRWRPDGQWLAWINSVGLTSTIYLARPDGSQKHVLTTHQPSESSAEWSPDGNWVAYLAEAGSNRDLFKVAAGLPPMPPPDIPGDLDHDGDVDADDLTLFRAAYGATQTLGSKACAVYNVEADLDGDGDVDRDDFWLMWYDNAPYHTAWAPGDVTGAAVGGCADGYPTAAPDDYVDLWDLEAFFTKWLTQQGDPNWDEAFDFAGPPGSSPAGPNKPCPVDGVVDFYDLMALAAAWSRGTGPASNTKVGSTTWDRTRIMRRLDVGASLR